MSMLDRLRLCPVALATLIVAAASAQTPLGTAITYQGQLTDAGAPANGTYDFRFALFTASVGGSQVGSTVCADNVSVSEGLFTVQLDFGDQFNGDQRFLEIGVRLDTTPGNCATGVYTTLGPRQPLTATPYCAHALDAGLLDGLDSSAFGMLGGAQTWTGANTFASASNSFTGSGTGLTNLHAANITSGTLSDARLSLNVDLLNSPQTFTALKTFSAGLSASSVGIGTSTPSADLHIRRNLANATARVDTTTGGNPALVLATVGQIDWHIGIDRLGSGNLTIGTGAVVGVSDHITVETDGDVGLGTTNPNYALDVIEANDVIIRARNTFSSGGTAVFGDAQAGSGLAIGVHGATASSSGYGVFSTGRMGATGTKSFVIDHPLDPANLFLRHYSSESPEPLNAYSGNIALDEGGQAWVRLPDYFHVINRDFRYQLTPIGAPAPNLHVAQEIRDGKFLIAGGRAGQKVSWRVEAVRDDPFVRAYGAPVVEEKALQHRGKYLHPELYGLPRERGIFHAAQNDTDAPQAPEFAAPP